MIEVQYSVPVYEEINDFLASIAPASLSSNPLFYCLRLRTNEDSVINYKPPFRKNFYFVGLVTNSGKTKITHDHTTSSRLDTFLVFQSPRLLYSFYRDAPANGYIIFFKKECLSFFKPVFESEFPFFNILHSNFLKLHRTDFEELAPYFEEVFAAYGRSIDNRHTIAAVKLLALLYQLKESISILNELAQPVLTPQQVLLDRFVRLVNEHYLERRTVEDYAGLLSVTPNHLSQSVKQASGKRALSFIGERIMSEAKSFLQFTTFDVAEISYQLNFSDPANFGKFFKQHAGLTPVEFRKRSITG